MLGSIESNQCGQSSGPRSGVSTIHLRHLHMIATMVGAYFVVGCVFVVVGPGRREISRKVAEVRGSDVANAVTGRVPPPRAKMVAFELTLSLVCALLWPALAVIVLQERSRQLKDQRQWEERVRSGIEFTRMGGAGSIHCRDCSYEQEIVSFTHGYSDTGPTSETGVQCLKCGKLTTLSEGHGTDDDTEAPCDCGGALSRDHVLFCPRCRSKNLVYEMRYIT